MESQRRQRRRCAWPCSFPLPGNARDKVPPVGKISQNRAQQQEALANVVLERGTAGLSLLFSVVMDNWLVERSCVLPGRIFAVTHIYHM